MRASTPKQCMMTNSSSNIYEHSEALRTKALAELGTFELDLGPVGQTSSVELLFIMNRKQSELSNELRAALEGVASGLNYPKTQYGILSISDLKDRLEQAQNALTLPEAIDLYVEVLDPEAVVVLEASILELWPRDYEVEKAPEQGAGRMQKFAYSNMRVVAMVSDFFACFSDPELKRLAWAQMLPASHAPIF